MIIAAHDLSARAAGRQPTSFGGASNPHRRPANRAQRILSVRPTESTSSLSDTLELPTRATGAAVFQRALDAGDLETCRRRLAEGALPDDERAGLYCRLSETLFYRGDRDAAIECAHAAFELGARHEPVAEFCAWLFSNCGRHQEAAAAYERLLDDRAEWAAGHRHASGSFAVAGETDRAIFHAVRACEMQPDAFEFAVHAGCLLAACGRHADAIGHLTRATELEPGDAGVLRHLSAAALALGDPEKAIALALRAHALAPVDRVTALHAAELLLRSDRFDEAAEIIARALAVDPEDDTAYRLLSAARMLRGRSEDALGAIDHALALAPAMAEYHLHRGNLLYRLGRFDEAAQAFDQAASLDPDNPAAKRSQLTVYFDSGRFREALAVGGELIRTAPDNEEYAQALLQVLNRRLETLDGDYIVLGERRSPPSRAPRLPPGLWAALRTQGRVVHALIIRETRTRFGDSTLGYGWALLEPILHILMLSLVFAVLMRGRPPIGTQFFIFYYTGIIPYHLFIHTSTSLTYAVSANGSLLQLPLVGTFDVILARALLELATDLLVAVILLAGFGALGLAVLPNDFVGLSGALAAVWLFGCGCGFINAVINSFFKSWDKIWAQFTRILYFCSGIFYVPGMMPDWIRDILAWNPVLHAVDWFRSSFFVDYEPHWLDRSYLAAVAGLTLMVGLGLERGLRRRLYEPL
jgi:ABC-type polysaccharide/polyol phosphate export permease/Flp pilus assembly protein TadD